MASCSINGMPYTGLEDPCCYFTSEIMNKDNRSGNQTPGSKASNNSCITFKTFPVNICGLLHKFRINYKPQYFNNIPEIQELGFLFLFFWSALVYQKQEWS